MSVSGLVPLYNVIVINMGDTDGQTATGRVFNQQVGFCKVAFRDSSGAPVNNSRLNLAFGRQSDDFVTLDYNGKARCQVPVYEAGKLARVQGVDTFRAAWANTPGVFAYLTVSPDANLFEDDTPNPIQSFTQSVGTTITTNNPSASAAGQQLIAASSLRQSAMIQNKDVVDVAIGGSGVTMSNGILLSPNQIIVLDKSSAAIFGRVTSGSATLRTLVETL